MPCLNIQVIALTLLTTSDNIFFLGGFMDLDIIRRANQLAVGILGYREVSSNSNIWDYSDYPSEGIPVQKGLGDPDHMKLFTFNLTKNSDDRENTMFALTSMGYVVGGSSLDDYINSIVAALLLCDDANLKGKQQQ